MLLASAPSKIVLPFAADAAAGEINVIPVPSQIPINTGAASYTTGFPPATFLDPTEGGVGPAGADFNGILNAISALSLWFNSGAGFEYDATFSTAVGGYPSGARVLRSNLRGYWRSVVDNNTTNPDTGGAGWVPEGGVVASSVYASAQQTLVTGFTKVLFDTVEYDDGLWNAANKRFVAPYAGRYRMSGSTLLSNPGGQLLGAMVYKNGVLAKQSIQTPQVSDGNLSLPFEATVNLAVGDFLEAFMSIPLTSVLAGTVGSNEAFVFAQVEYLG